MHTHTHIYAHDFLLASTLPLKYDSTDEIII